MVFQTVDTDFSPGDDVQPAAIQSRKLEFQTVDTDFSPGDAMDKLLIQTFKSRFRPLTRISLLVTFLPADFDLNARL